MSQDSVDREAAKITRKELLAIRSTLGIEIEIGIDWVRVEELRLIHAYGEKPRVELRVDTVAYAYFFQWQQHFGLRPASNAHKRDIVVSLGKLDLWIEGAWPNAISLTDCSVTLLADNHRMHQRLGVPV